MPLVRFAIRNEYGLGAPELYKEADKDNNPKALLDGVAVAGLVGILRQLGDLAELLKLRLTEGVLLARLPESINWGILLIAVFFDNFHIDIEAPKNSNSRFAAEVFQDLQEQVMSTSARSHKMMVRLQYIEESLLPLEKVVMSQKNHIHFAYTIGMSFPTFIYQNSVHSNKSISSWTAVALQFLLVRFDTGGPGACLKRYSDPSFFKRALAKSDPLGAEKVVGTEKETRKRKEKLSGLNNGEVSHNKPDSRHNGRMHGVTMNMHEQNFDGETLSIFEMGSKSEVGTETTSFDSRMRSDYIKCISDVSSSIPQEDQDNNVFQHGSAQERATNLCSIKWDEKTEIVDPASQRSRNFVEKQREASQLMTVGSDPSRLECENLGHVHVDTEDILCEDENILDLLSHRNQFNLVEGDQDNYVDALNTMVSESETDFEHHITRGVELPSDSSDIEHEPCNAANISSESMPQIFSPGVSSEDLFNAGLPQTTCMSSVGDLTVETDMCESTYLLDVNTSEAPNSQALVGDKISSSSDAQPSDPIISGGPSIKFWTNGGLLGLEPSKPPDSGMVSRDLTHGNRTDEHSLKKNTSMAKSHSDGPLRKQKALVKSPEQVEEYPCPKGEQDGSADAVVPEVERLSTDVSQENAESSSTMVGPSSRLLVNDFRRRILLRHDEISEPSTSAYQTPEPNSKEHLKRLSASNSTSPPLGHMKISFHPVDGFRTSKQKLKFPEGRGSHDGNMKDAIFPSFQLLPEPTVISSDSDDDTFNKSSEYMSDELISNLSESNSEQWDSEETLTSEDHDAYDALRRVSSTDSILCSLRSKELSHHNLQCLDNENDIKAFNSDLSVDLPNFEVLDPLESRKERERRSDSNDIDFMLQYLNETTPPPPPLPPVQWRVTNPHFPLLQDNQVVISNEVSHQYAPQRPKLATEQPKLAPQEQPNIMDPTQALQKNEVMR
ncbi:hypothetical protein GIB67_032077 [Kingdonia uniflora]|uniref:Protein SCAR n=1 Tax=Kingdonia uniflora TaxID=39325 RepID=A0A7J7MWP9_9MAGN|nr:hypothetical protein GIB67_032077 [Kingdonia uniflora]